MKLSISLLLFPYVFSQYIEIVSPSYHIDYYSDGKIPISVANFGFNRYGQGFEGTLVFPDHGDYNCSTMHVDYFGVKQAILVFLRGGCMFAEFAKIAQDAGGKGVVIINNVDSDITSLIMASSKPPDFVQAFAVMVSKRDGEMLSQINSNEIIVKITIPIEVSSPVKLNLILTGNRSKDLYMINSLNKAIGSMSIDDVTIEIDYNLSICKECGRNHYKVKQDDCLSGGRYCIYDTTSRGKGSDMIYDLLRNSCALQIESDSKYENLSIYYSVIYSECIISYNSDCISNSLSTYFDAAAIDTCISNSTIGKDIYINNNQILSKEYQESKDNTHYPTFQLNSFTYLGSFDSLISSYLICQFLPTLSICPYYTTIDYDSYFPSYQPTDCSPNCQHYKIGNKICEPECNLLECDYDLGDCDTCSEGCYLYMLGNGECNQECELPACRYDAEDCSQCRCDNNLLGNGECNVECYTNNCYYDYGDCDSDICAYGCFISYLNDGVCDVPCMVEECGYDAVDCNACGCSEDVLGDGLCNEECNIEECLYDYGDCESDNEDDSDIDSEEELDTENGEQYSLYDDSNNNGKNAGWIYVKWAIVMGSGFIGLFVM
jgi:hypothetical protein